MTHHAEGLSRLIDDAGLIEALKNDYRSAALDARDCAMLDYVVKVTREPCACTKDDVDALRAVGFGDADIHDLVQTAAYYAFVNRTACGLGVELEDYWDEG